MKKSLIILLVLVTVMMPLLVSCDDISMIEKIGKMVAEFSGVGTYSAEETKMQTEEATSEVNKAFESDEIDFKDITNLLLNYPAITDLEKVSTNIKLDVLNEKAKECLPKETMLSAMTTATDLIDSLDLGTAGDMLEGVAETLENVAELCTKLKNTGSKEGNATLKDVQLVSAQAAMAESLSAIASPVFTALEDSENLDEDAITGMIGGIVENLQAYNSAAETYAAASGEDASDYAINISDLLANFGNLGSRGEDD